MKTILVAEDEAITQKLISTVLQHLSFNGIVTSNGKECLDKLTAGLTPDMLLLDLEMPEMSGLEVMEAIIKQGHMEKFPIVVFTSHKDKNVIMKAINLGAHDYILKPFNVIGLGKRISDLMFDINEEALKSILANLRIDDPYLFRSPGLQEWAQRGYQAYPARHEGKTLALLIPEDVKPHALAKEPFEKLLTYVIIFKKDNFGWRKVWPTSSLLPK